MAFYICHATYTDVAIATMAKNPQDRSIPVKKMVQKAEEFDRLYQQMLGEMLAKDFGALETFLTAWGEKP